MALQSLTRQVPTPLQAKLHRAVDDLDHSIADIRATIYALHTTDDQPPPLRQQIIALIDATTDGTTLHPDLQLTGPLDTLLSADLSNHTLAVLREALTNVVRHAKATTITITITATDHLHIQVTDNGIGIPPNGRRSGLANLADRATQLGGTFATEPGPHGTGTHLSWNVPLD
jgi:signal transduction histidine kinase